MKLFRGKEVLIQDNDLVKPSIYTPLGTIEFSLAVTSECYLPTHGSQLKHGGSLYQYYYDSFNCELVLCNLNHNLSSYQEVDECWGAVFRIRPNTHYRISKCSFSALWKAGYSWEDYGSDTGENLEAVEYANEQYRLHIGTQEEPLIMGKRNQGDMSPKSLDLDSDSEKYSFVLHSDQGIEVPVIQMDSHEICQVHFLIAWKRKIEEDISTWLAVDQPTKEILKGEDIW
ncbi:MULTISPECIES: hypothetical protein [Paenibacillus]|uniref:Uncharacterized protein n=1 Tax=Paenibacillus pabuli TaxID=1472 RepID=A0A855Y2F8_9BACL|nr:MULTISPECIES: hypothetical protein [Paenibacillus]PWW45496.1 hypothetical protein DET56_101705 [Paenibacillus pabuli]PXW11833.1 hypothetical protein DEU73_101704 [Paenibacillus taichungensis]RAI84458.1 hypothetical protein DET54_12536 [Paenibacillus pabuli]